MANLAHLVPVLLVALFIREGEAMRCWTCTSHLSPDCSDPFLVDSHDTSYIQLSDCGPNSTRNTFPYQTSYKPACMKQNKYIHGVMVTSRGCTWKRADDNSTSCPSSSTRPNEVISFCETCDFDGCNGAAAVGNTIALLLTPLTLLLFK